MRKFFIGLVATFISITLNGQGVKPLPTLHVDGKWLVDMHGNHVVLHGVMDTPNMYFNGWRWGTPWGGENGYADYNAEGVTKCLNYFEKIFAGLEEAKCNVFRLHLDPAWTNDPSSSYSYAVAANQPSEATSEADIKKFNPERLRTFLASLYIPLMQKAMAHGQYVVVRPPGVCPPNLKVGDYYQTYLLEVWDIVSKDETIKQYAGQISLELANEPVNLKDANGNDNAKALHDYFQPIVDKIRANGFTGIIWVPGTGWQSNYRDYATYPVTGYNIGYAVHDYTGWYGCSDDTPSPQNKINNFHYQVPVVDTNPIIITEVDWSPNKPGTGHYNEHGDWVESNYGTWSTGTTSKWGKAYKTMLDYFGNISMTLSGTGCLIDIDELINNNKVTAAFGGEPEACGKACMDWYAEYYEVDWPHADIPATPEEQGTATKLTLSDVASQVMIGQSGKLQVVATYQDGHKANVASEVTCTTSSNGIIEINDGQIRGLREGEANVDVSYVDPMGNTLTETFKVRSTFFPFGAQYIKTDIFDNGTYNENTHTFHPGQWGQMGWVYPDGVDFSGYKYLVVKLKEPQNCGAHLNIFTSNNIWDGQGSFETPEFMSETEIVIDLTAAKYLNGNNEGQPLDTKNIHIVDFWSFGTGDIVVEDVFLSKGDADDEPTVTVDADNPKLELSKAFTEGGCVPDGWITYDSSEGRTGYSNGYWNGCRILQLTGSQRDFDYGFYFRNISGDAHAGYVKYGAKGGTARMALAPGHYELRYKICSWNREDMPPVSVCVEKADNGSVVSSQQCKPTVNIDNDASNSFSGVQEETLSFDIPQTDNYVLAFYTQDSGWADAIIGSLTLTYILPGDVNGDGRVDRDDVTCLISHLLGQKPARFSAAAANVNPDDNVDIADVAGIIGIILARSSQ